MLVSNAVQNPAIVILLIVPRIHVSFGLLGFIPRYPFICKALLLSSPIETLPSSMFVSSAKTMQYIHVYSSLLK